MKILHCADSHLGLRAMTKLAPDGRNQRTVDIENAYRKVVDAAIERKVDLFIHAGDVFDRPRPSWGDIAFFIAQTQHLLREGIAVALVAGNHDTSTLRSRDNVFSVIQQACPDVMMAHGGQQMYFCRPDYMLNLIASRRLKSEYPPSAEGVGGVFNILVTHGIASSITLGRGAAEPGEEQIPDHLLDPTYDYCAIGDAHFFQQVRPNAWYAGSTERMNWGEKDAIPGFLLVELAENTRPVVEHVEVPGRPMVQLESIPVTDLEPGDILNDAYAQIDALAMPDAMTRVLLTEVTQKAITHTLHRLMARHPPACWSLSFQVQEKDKPLVTDHVSGFLGADIPKIELREAFREFVATRDFDPSFRESFIAKGDLALATALQREAERDLAED